MRKLHDDTDSEPLSDDGRSRRLLFKSALSAAGSAMLGARGLAAPVADEPQSPVNRSAEARDLRLKGLHVKLSRPRVVAETSVGRCWFPDLLKFSTGELMLNHSLNADENLNSHNSQAVYLSIDGGKHFDFAYDVNGFHNVCGEPRISLPDGRIVGMSCFLKPQPAGQARRFVAHYWSYDRGGRRYSVEPWSVTVEGLPRDVLMWERPSRTWWAHINWFTDVIPLADNRWISTLSLRYAGDKRESTEALVSSDQGRSWKYLSTIAGPNSVPDAIEGFDEPCLIRLDDGDIMCISRVGSGEKQKLARTYSSDGGKSWSAIDRLPAHSVMPQICRTSDGVLALSTGRPGLWLWLSTDKRGKNWQPIDLMAHHNAMVDKRWHIVHGEIGNYAGPEIKTTAGTAMVPMSGGRILLVYDRIPFGWHAVPAKSGEKAQIYLLEVQVSLA